MMKKIIFTLMLAALYIQATAQNTNERPFQAYLYNEEYQVWLDINFYDNNINVPSQEIFGELPGYFGAKRDTRKWLITDATVKGNTATLTIVNDYGSEDLTATLTCNGDSKQLEDGSVSGATYTLTQKSGSTMKIVVNRKWVKLPKKLTFTRTDNK
jgi:hypothetical protein